MNKKYFYNFSFLILVLPILLSSDCSGEKLLNIPPEILIIGENNNEITDTSFFLGENVNVIVKVREKIYPISFFKVKILNGSEKIIADTFFKISLSEFNFRLHYYKSSSKTDTIEVTVSDSKGISSKKSILIHLKGEKYDSLLSFSDILLGARFYPGNKSFLSVFNEMTYTYDIIDAYNYQSRVDFFYYYYNQKYVMASPGAAFEPDLFSGATPKYDVNNWPLRNRTIYKKSDISPDEFQKIINDSFLKNNPDFTNAYDKVSMKKDDIFIFSTENQKLGLMKINALNGKDSGYVVIDLKIQK